MLKYIKQIKAKIKKYKETYPEGNLWDMCNYLDINVDGYDVQDDKEWDAFNNAMLFVLIKENPQSSELVERFGTAEQIYAYSDWESQKQHSDSLAMAYGRGDHNISMKDLQDEQALTDKSWNEFIATIKGE